MPSTDREAKTQVDQPVTGATVGGDRADLEVGPELFVNRELSLLEFQRRVLEEAEDPANPLLERVKFLAILASNLDEFFMVRVGGLKMQVDAGVVEPTVDGLTPAEQLAAIRKVAHGLMQQGHHVLAELRPELDRAGIHVLDIDELNPRQQANVQQVFEEIVFPVLTPLAFDPGRPFPHISNLSLNLAVLIRDPAGQEHFARVKVPSTLPRLLPIKRSSGGLRKDGTVPHHHYFVWLEQVIAANLHRLFYGMEVLEAHPFRVTRNADMDIQEIEAGDLLETMEESVRLRRFGAVVRVTVSPEMPSRVRDILATNLDVPRQDVYTLDRPLGLGSLMNLYGGIERHDLKDLQYVPTTPASLRPDDGRPDIFSAIRERDILLHHPYDSFTPVLDFLSAAARDPAVLAIKQTLYRVGRNAPAVRSLLDARENGKQVAALVELKARFDEESNIGWARALEQEGVHVVYGLLGLKTHSKVALVVRREGKRIRRYMHLATGNYNAVTAHLYTDIGLFTDDEDIGADVTDLFNYLTGHSAKTEYRKLLVAPINLRQRFTALIEREIEHAAAGRPAHLVFVMNSLADPPIIRQLYRASRAGVKVDLIVRGVCCLRPGVPGVSDNIRVISIVGRFLEHSRIYSFHNGGDDQIFIGSADLMPRNIDRRVEVLFPVEEPSLVRRLLEEVLAVQLSDNVRARQMRPDGSYERIRPGAGEAPTSSQERLMALRAARPPE